MPNKKNKKQLLIVPWITMIISGVVLIFVIVIFGYLAYYTTVLEPILKLSDHQALLEQKIEKVQPDVDLEEVVEEDAVVVEEMNVYTSRIFDFQFEYSKNWVIDDSYSDLLNFLLVKLEDRSITTKSPFSDYASLWVEVNSPGRGIEYFNTVISTDKIIVDGIIADRQEISGIYDNNKINAYVVRFEKGGDSYFIHYQVDSKKWQENKKKFNTFLSSFEFID